MYKPTIGLEIHVELKTKTKMFCGCLNDSDEKHPNINVCPICMGHPGTLPVINKKAVEAVLKLGMTLNSQIPEFSKFDRKNYFYPDLPKGYQISQYDTPLCLGGYLDIQTVEEIGNIENTKTQKHKNIKTQIKKIKITRIHLEEDAGKLMHKDGVSLVDFNRAGVALMELVTEPDIFSASEAKIFAKELQLILQYLEISDANMEKGQMRCEANISVSKNEQLGVKVEVKNLNSFQSLERAIDYEIKRQVEVLESGEKIIHETRGFDENKGVTFSQRGKESAHDYRYFPEPDLPLLELKIFGLAKIKSEIAELPSQKRARFKKEFNIKETDIEIIVSDKLLAKFFEEAVSELLDSDKNNITAVQLLVNYLNNDLLNIVKELNLEFKELKLTPENFAELIDLVHKDKISSRVAKDVLIKMVKEGGDPSQMIEEAGLLQTSDVNEIEKIVKEIIASNEKLVVAYKDGKVQVIEALIGQTIKAMKGKANPKVIKEIMMKELG